jgi:hypothetical protein
MKASSAFALSVAAAVLAACLGLTWLSDGPRTARAGCGDNAADPPALFAFQPPAKDFQVVGPAPLALSATWLIDAVVPAGSTASLDWGDGSAPTPFSAKDCGGGMINWPVQTLTHTFTSEGPYQVTWSLHTIDVNLKVPVVFVTVGQAETATAVTTPPPTQAATPTAPAATSTTTAAPSPTQPAATAAVAATATTPAAPSPTPSLTPTPSPAAATAVAALSSSSPSPSPAPKGDLPETLFSAPRFDEISTDPGTVATNALLAGATLWVLFSSVLLNQVLQDNRSEIDAKTARLAGPLRRLVGRAGGQGNRGVTVATAVVVVALTGLIYGFLDPGFGANRESLLLFLSAVLGVGILTYACSGLEALATRRGHGLSAAVRPYPASIAVAVASVALSRMLDLQPGVVYGFVASAAITGPGEIERHKQGSVTIYPVLAALILSIAALLAIEPLRGNSEAASSFAGQLAIGAGIIIFIGGIEGVAFNMVPLAVTDGGKLFAWRKPVWAVLALVSAFLAWHVLLNRDRQNFETLRETSSLTIFVIFVFYSALSIGLWVYFWRRGRGPDASEADAGP